MLHPVIIPSLP